MVNLPASQRDFSFENLAGAEHLTPVIDSGSHRGDLVIVMPRAEIDLRAYLDYRGGALPLDEAVPILRDVVAGLTEMEGGGVIETSSRRTYSCTRGSG